MLVHLLTAGSEGSGNIRNVEAHKSIKYAMHPPCVEWTWLSIPGMDRRQRVWTQHRLNAPGTTSISVTILASMTCASSRLGTTEISTSSSLAPMEEAKWSGLA